MSEIAITVIVGLAIIFIGGPMSFGFMLWLIGKSYD
jgi:hypothetical protein